MNIKNKKIVSQKHRFHMVDPSPWPILISFAAMTFLFGMAMTMHGYIMGPSLRNLGFFSFYIILDSWLEDVKREAVYEGQHTSSVRTGIKIGMILFIITELMFFVSFFWAFFHCSLNPGLGIGGVWPPADIPVINPWGLPLVNTILLLSSGASITWAHHSLLSGSKNELLIALGLTIAYACAFLEFQAREYISANFTISDGIYGSTFYMLTGLHGLHVIIGAIFICVCFIRSYDDEFTIEHHVGFETCVWYWHFVDIVWLFLYGTVYCWGS